MKAGRKKLPAFERERSLRKETQMVAATVTGSAKKAAMRAEAAAAIVRREADELIATAADDASLGEASNATLRKHLAEREAELRDVVRKLVILNGRAESLQELANDIADSATALSGKYALEPVFESQIGQSARERMDALLAENEALTALCAQQAADLEQLAMARVDLHRAQAEGFVPAWLRRVATEFGMDPRKVPKTLGDKAGPVGVVYAVGLRALRWAAAPVKSAVEPQIDQDVLAGIEMAEPAEILDADFDEQELAPIVAMEAPSGP